MEKICIFAGTTEGRELVDFLRPLAVDLTVCVATEYGETMLNQEGITLHTGRLSLEEMLKFLPTFSLVVDCTHPYATVVTGHIISACHQGGIEYLRVNRECDMEELASLKENVKEVASMKEMAEYLETTTGRIFSTLGSKELLQFQGCSFVERLYARVLPVAWSLESCGNIGIPPARMIAVQGPFSYEYNKAMFQTYEVTTMLTKESGGAGGFEQKCQAALDLGLEVVVLAKPPQQVGLSFESATLWLVEWIHDSKTRVAPLTEKEDDKYGEDVAPQEKAPKEEPKKNKEKKSSLRKLSIISCGMGYEMGLTLEAKEALEQAELCLGTARLLEVLKCSHQDSAPIYAPEKVKQFLDQYTNYINVALLVTGDCGFYSAGKEIHKQLPDFDCTYFSGISSPVYLASRLGIGWDDCHFVSLHGRDVNVLPTILRNQKTFVLFGGVNTVESLCELLLEYNINATLSIGEHLGSEDENIVVGTPKELIDQCFLSLSCGFVELQQVPEPSNFGWCDTVFERTEKVPMTKAEVRAVTLSKLQLEPTSIIYDVGAGTGSVSVEMGNLAPRGKVYALEKKESALAILDKNKKKFYMEHMDIISGDAMEEVDHLPCPTHVFIGGFSGDLSGLLEKIKEKGEESKQKIRFVINTVTLETLTELTPCFSSFSKYEIVEVAISRGTKRGNYHMMLANNPVFVVTLESDFAEEC